MLADALEKLVNQFEFEQLSTLTEKAKELA